MRSGKQFKEMKIFDTSELFRTLSLFNGQTVPIFVLGDGERNESLFRYARLCGLIIQAVKDKSANGTQMFFSLHLQDNLLLCILQLDYTSNKFGEVWTIYVFCTVSFRNVG